MAIKKNTQKILLLLNTAQSISQQLFPLDVVSRVVPDLSESGFRSLVVLMEKRKLIFRERTRGITSIGISEQGKRTLIATFPALDSKWSSWEGDWSMLIFLEAPAGDPHFRYLRSVLISAQSMVVSRGVYAIAGAFPRAILHELETLYSGNTLLVSGESTQMGFNRPLINTYYDLGVIVDLYSGIGNEIDSLLEKYNAKIVSIDQYKISISTIMDRIISCLSTDPGFIHYYYPGLPGLKEIWDKLRRLSLL